MCPNCGVDAYDEGRGCAECGFGREEPPRETAPQPGAVPDIVSVLTQMKTEAEIIGLKDTAISAITDAIAAINHLRRLPHDNQNAIVAGTWHRISEMTREEYDNVAFVWCEESQRLVLALPSGDAWLAGYGGKPMVVKWFLRLNRPPA